MRIQALLFASAASPRPVPQSLVNDIATRAERLAKERPPFGILGREIDAVLTVSRGIVREGPQATWEQVRALCDALRRLRAAALVLPIGAPGPSDPRIKALDNVIASLHAHLTE